MAMSALGNHYQGADVTTCKHSDQLLLGRGFILFRLGLAGGGITTTEPPLAVIFSVADFVT